MSSKIEMLKIKLKIFTKNGNFIKNRNFENRSSIIELNSFTKTLKFHQKSKYWSEINGKNK